MSTSFTGAGGGFLGFWAAVCAIGPEAEVSGPAEFALAPEATGAAGFAAAGAAAKANPATRTKTVAELATAEMTRALGWCRALVNGRTAVVETRPPGDDE
jgi:hypothetical protein